MSGPDQTASDPANSESDRPVLRVVRGEPTPEELAALVAVLAARGSGSGQEPSGPVRGGWGDHGRSMRTSLPHGPGRWRAAALPR